MTPLTLADTAIRQDAHGRYCLNDLHKAAVAAGANKRSTEPNRFFRSPQIQAAISILEAESAAEQTTPIWRSLESQSDARIPGITLTPVATIEGREGGTFVAKELVYAYAMFVSPAFNIKVIRTFDAVVNGEHAMPHIQSTKFWDLLRPHWAEIARLAMAGCKNTQIAPLVKRSVGSVGRCLRRMFDVGYLNPVAVFQARLSPATAARWAISKPVATQWGRADCGQLSLAL